MKNQFSKKQMQVYHFIVASFLLFNTERCDIKGTSDKNMIWKLEQEYHFLQKTTNSKLHKCKYSVNSSH